MTPESGLLYDANGNIVDQTQILQDLDNAFTGNANYPTLRTSEQTAGWKVVHSVAYAVSLIIKDGPGRLRELNGFSAKSTPQWIQLHDSASVPGSNAVPVWITYVQANSPFYYDPGESGLDFVNGIVVSNSSAGPSLSGDSADCFFTARYR